MNKKNLHEQMLELGINDIATNEVMKDTSMNTDSYVITATRSQVAQISEACNTMARLELAQLNALLDVLPLEDGVDCWGLLQKLESLLRPYLKQNMEFSQYFPMHQVLRHRLSWDKYPEGGLTVNFDEPLIVNDEPLIKIAKTGKKGLTQDVFVGQPVSVKSAHVDANGVAFLNECKIDKLRVVDGQHLSMVSDCWQKPVGRGYDTTDWQNSPINRHTR